METQTDDLHWKTVRVRDALRASDEPLTIRELARKCFPGVRPREKADSQVRNHLRVLVPRGEARKVRRGTYEA